MIPGDPRKLTAVPEIFDKKSLMKEGG